MASTEMDKWIHDLGYWSSNPLSQRQFTEQLGPTPKRILVDKRTHRICYENESESSVVLVIEPKESNVSK